MIRIVSIDRKVEIDNEGKGSEGLVRVVIAIPGDDAVNKARFRLTDEENAKFDAFARQVEKRLADSVIIDPEVG
jgi:transcription elongation GreA/GreB family factor